jgi:hypothetical protein
VLARAAASLPVAHPVHRAQGRRPRGGGAHRAGVSKSGRTLYYRGQRFRSLKGRGFKSNYFDVATGEPYWISGPRKDGHDRLYGGNRGVVIDEDVRAEYEALLKR